MTDAKRQAAKRRAYEGTAKRSRLALLTATAFGALGAMFAAQTSSLMDQMQHRQAKHRSRGYQNPMRPRRPHDEVTRALAKLSNWQFNQWNRAGAVRSVNNIEKFAAMPHWKTVRRLGMIGVGLDLARETGDPGVLRDALAGKI